jgi:predicted alpha/beta superfamily hydrolase
MDMKKILVWLLLLPYLLVSKSEANDLTLPTIQVVPIEDSQSDRQYELYVKLPEGYSKNKDKTYPVIYYTDAMWHVEMLSGATEYLMGDVILVGISWQKDMKKGTRAYFSRFRDYSITKSDNLERQAKYQHGQASNHLDFIRNDVIKFVENSYRTNPDNRTYFGYSLGGLFGAYILMAQPDTFKNYILGGPALSGDIPLLLELGATTALKRKGLNANVFISYGELDKKLGVYAEEFIALLKNRNDESLSLHHIVIASADHSQAFPKTVIPSLDWLSAHNKRKGPYLGQKPPGLIPQIFAPGLVSSEHREAGAAFAPDLKTFYFRRKGGEFKKHALMAIQHKGNRWTESVVARRGGRPFISADGKIMHLGKKFRARTDDGWSELKSLGAPFKDIRIMRLTASDKGTYYFDEASETGPIRYSRIIDGKREKPSAVDIKMGNWNAHPFIAPDESYLVWDDQGEGGYGHSDLYVAFAQKNGSWGEAINLGDKINTQFEENFGSVTPDGKYFFFGRSAGDGKANIFWVDAQVIEAHRPKS